MRIVSFVGTRPEAIKLAPVVHEAARRGYGHRLVTTGQHRGVVTRALAGFGLASDHDLGLLRLGRTLEQRVDRIRSAATELLGTLRPDLVLVQGDTTSAYASALAAHDLGLAIGHVEAGLRSGDLTQPYPEEGYRIAIDRIATLLFAPTALARANLAADPLVRGLASVTGNTGIDALLTTRRGLAVHGQLPRGRLAAAAGKRLILATCHRRENIGAPIGSICAAIAELGARPDVHVVLPVHQNRHVRAEVRALLHGAGGVTLLEALPYDRMVWLMDRSTLILTDSGGLQEEGPTLGKPVLVLRNVTERPEAKATGNLQVIGTDADRIVAAAERLLDDPAAYAEASRSAFPYGRGDAAARILDAIERWATSPLMVVDGLHLPPLDAEPRIMVA